MTRFPLRPKRRKNPQRDIPFGIIASLIVCTILYVGVALVLLGMMPYPLFRTGTRVVQVQLDRPVAGFEEQVKKLPSVGYISEGQGNLYRVVYDGDNDRAQAAADQIKQLAVSDGATVRSSSVANASDAPVAYALAALGANRWLLAIVIIGALTGMLSSLLVFQYGQTRIWFAMSRDRLLPGFFSTVHKVYKTPHWSTWIAGFAVGLPSGLVDIGDAADLSNIGTLFAFVLVSLGVLFLRRTQPDRPRGFKVPLVPIFPLMSVILCGGLMTGLTVMTWIRFFVWLGLGLVIYFVYSRRRSEFAKA